MSETKLETNSKEYKEIVANFRLSSPDKIIETYKTTDLKEFSEDAQLFILENAANSANMSVENFLEATTEKFRPYNVFILSDYIRNTQYAANTMALTDDEVKYRKNLTWMNASFNIYVDTVNAQREDAAIKQVADYHGFDKRILYAVPVDI